jgi:hypothetical protein
MCIVQLIKLCDHILLAAVAELKLLANISLAATTAAAAAAMLQVVVAVQSAVGERSCTVLLLV